MSLPSSPETLEGVGAGEESRQSGAGELWPRMAFLDQGVRRLLDLRGEGDPVDPLGSLMISREDVERMVAERPRVIDLDDDGGATALAEARLSRLALRFDLTSLDVDLLCVAMAPDLERRYARAFAYLQDDFSARSASVGLALDLTGRSPTDPEARARLQPGGALIDGGLVEVADAGVGFLQQPLAVKERVVRHLLGDDRVHPSVERLLLRPLPDLLPGAADLGTALSGRSPVVYLREPAEGLGVGHALAACTSVGRPAIAVDVVSGLVEGDDRIIDKAVLEARLSGSALIVPFVEELAGVPGAVDGLCRLNFPVVLVGEAVWEPAWSRRVPLCLELPPLDLAGQRRLWAHALRVAGVDIGDEAFEGLPGFDLSPVQVLRTADQAVQRASHDRRDLTEEDLRNAARNQNGSAMLNVARRIAPSARWDDLVIGADVRDRLRELLNRVKLAPQVLDRWDLRTSARRRAGVKSLFSGPPGTGKTLAAEVIAGSLGLDLFVVDLSTVVDKYIGETEKHLERLFRSAAEANCVLFFDEADALFGKRSGVEEAKDRYANIEVSYLLQRLDAFDGFVILATNLLSNVDEAFIRRLDVIVHMAMPGLVERLALWDRCLGQHMPRDADVDLDFLAKSFELSGGSIRNIALTAAYFAAEGSGTLRMEDLIWGIEREYRKTGLLASEAEFGPWWPMVSKDMPLGRSVRRATGR